MLPLLAAIGAMVSGGLAAKSASDHNKEAKRRDNLNADLTSLDTRFSPFNKGSSRQAMGRDPLDKKSVMGNTLGGAMTGGIQGANIASAMANSNAYRSLLDKMSKEQGTSMADLIRMRNGDL